MALATGIPVASWEQETPETVATAVHLLQEQERNRRK